MWIGHCGLCIEVQLKLRLLILRLIYVYHLFLKLHFPGAGTLHVQCTKYLLPHKSAGFHFFAKYIDPLFPQLTIIYLVIIWLLFIFLWTVFITIPGNNKSNIHVEITLIFVIFLSDFEEKNKVLLSLERVKLFKIIFIYTSLDSI